MTRTIRLFCILCRETDGKKLAEYRSGDGRWRNDWNYETMLHTLQGDRWKEVSRV